MPCWHARTLKLGNWRLGRNSDLAREINRGTQPGSTWPIYVTSIIQQRNNGVQAKLREPVTARLDGVRLCIATSAAENRICDHTCPDRGWEGDHPETVAGDCAKNLMTGARCPTYDRAGEK
jgi:hypothetical protein